MIIGVTGGVGAGKSTVLQILKESFGAHIIMADEVAKKLMEPGGASYEAVVEAFGEEILEEGTAEAGRKIDRAKLAAVVFADDEKLLALNGMTHPLVREAIETEICMQYETEPKALIVIEAALLIEAGYEDILDRLWVIDADPEIRIQRLMESRGYTREKCESIMDNQLSSEEFRAHADEVIDNSGTREETRGQIEAIFRRMQENA